MRKSVTQNDIVKAFEKAMPKFETVNDEKLQQLADVIYGGDYDTTRELVIVHGLRCAIDMLYEEIHRNDKIFERK